MLVKISARLNRRLDFQKDEASSSHDGAKGTKSSDSSGAQLVNDPA